MSTFRFRLYVMGRTSRASLAEEQLRALCQGRLPDRFEVEVVDVAERPDLAEAERIVATPTLDRISPEPRLRVVGDLGSRDRLALVLDLPPDKHDEQERT